MCWINPDVKVILLPRNDKQKEFIMEKWPQGFTGEKFYIPEKAVDGLNLIWNSDLVISGGGTMNREAAALKFRFIVYFRGKTGAIDRYFPNKNDLS